MQYTFKTQSEDGSVMVWAGSAGSKRTSITVVEKVIKIDSSILRLYKCIFFHLRMNSSLLFETSYKMGRRVIELSTSRSGFVMKKLQH